MAKHLKPFYNVTLGRLFNFIKEMWLSYYQGRLRVYIHGKDDVPGSPVYSSLIDALERSRKIVIVLSNSFLKSEKCRGFADLACCGRDLKKLEDY